MVKCESIHFNIEAESIKNEDFRHVVFTGQHFQVVMMSLKPRESIGMEAHPHTDQFFRVEEGIGYAVVGGKEYALEAGDALIVPAGTRHNVGNRSTVAELKLYTIYAPPQHDACKVAAVKVKD